MGDSATHAALTQRSLAHQSRIYEEYGRGNRAAVLGAPADDVVWTSAAGPGIPWGGTHRGRARILATGTEQEFAKADVIRIGNGRILEFREFYDTAAVLAALGAAPRSN